MFTKYYFHNNLFSSQFHLISFNPHNTTNSLVNIFKSKLLKLIIENGNDALAVYIATSNI